MKLCVIPDKLDVHHIINNATISNCLYMFSSEPPHSSIFFDFLSSISISLFFVITLCLSGVFIVLKKNGKIICQFKESYLIITLIASFLHVISVFMTYGFFWPHINDHVTIHVCSLFNFWLQWFLGFGVWISVLCIRIFSIAQTTIPRLINSNSKIVLLQRLAFFFLSLGFVVMIGVIAEVTHAFVIEDDNKCITKLWVKFLILLWLLCMILFLLIISYIIKKQSLINEDSHLLNMEVKIIRVTWPILLVCIILNFSGLTIYGVFRFIFIMLIISIYIWSSMVLYINHVILHLFGDYQITNVILDFLDINPVKKYTLLDSDSISTLEMINNNFSRDNILNTSDEENQYDSQFIINSKDGSSASLLLTYNNTNPFVNNGASSNPQPSSSTASIALNNTLNNLNMENLNDQAAMKIMIKTNNDCLNEFCKKLVHLCDLEFKNTGIHKNFEFSVFDSNKDQFNDHTVILKFLINMFNEYRESYYLYQIRQIKQDEYIKKISNIIYRYISKDLQTTYINISSNNVNGELSFGKTSDQLLLNELSRIHIIPEIIFKLKTYQSYEDKEKYDTSSLLESFKEFYDYLLDKIVDDYFSFWQQSEGFQEMMKTQNQKTEAVKSIINDADTIF